MNEISKETEGMIESSDSDSCDEDKDEMNAFCSTAGDKRVENLSPSLSSSGGGLLMNGMNETNAGLQNKKWVLKRYPDGPFNAQRDFRFVQDTLDLNQVSDDEVVVEVEAISIDSFIRTMVTSDITKVDGSISAMGYGKVIKENSTFSEGSSVVGLVQVAKYAVVKSDALQTKASFATPSSCMGVLGISGVTAYIGMFVSPKKCPQKGETVVVSAAAGVVGCIASQIAKLCKSRVIGITSGQAQKRFLIDRLKLDGAIDYADRRKTVDEQLEELCPNGIDFFFDNSGGDILNAVLKQINKRSRLVICGAISQNGDEGTAKAPSHYLRIAETSSTMSGFNTMDFPEYSFKAIRYLSWHYMRGNIICPLRTIEGIESFARAIEYLPIHEPCVRIVVDIRDVIEEKEPLIDEDRCIGRGFENTLNESHVRSQRATFAIHQGEETLSRRDHPPDDENIEREISREVGKEVAPKRWHESSIVVGVDGHTVEGLKDEERLSDDFDKSHVQRQSEKLIVGNKNNIPPSRLDAAKISQEDAQSHHRPCDVEGQANGEKLLKGISDDDYQSSKNDARPDELAPDSKITVGESVSILQKTNGSANIDDEVLVEEARNLSNDMNIGKNMSPPLVAHSREESVSSRENFDIENDEGDYIFEPSMMFPLVAKCREDASNREDSDDAGKPHVVNENAREEALNSKKDDAPPLAVHSQQETASSQENDDIGNKEKDDEYEDKITSLLFANGRDEATTSQENDDIGNHVSPPQAINVREEMACSHKEDNFDKKMTPPLVNDREEMGRREKDNGFEDKTALPFAVHSRVNAVNSGDNDVRNELSRNQEKHKKRPEISSPPHEEQSTMKKDDQKSSSGSTATRLLESSEYDYHPGELTSDSNIIVAESEEQIGPSSFIQAETQTTNHNGIIFHETNTQKDNISEGKVMPVTILDQKDKDESSKLSQTISPPDEQSTIERQSDKTEELSYESTHHDAHLDNTVENNKFGSPLSPDNTRRGSLVCYSTDRIIGDLEEEETEEVEEGDNTWRTATIWANSERDEESNVQTARDEMALKMLEAAEHMDVEDTSDYRLHAMPH